MKRENCLPTVLLMALILEELLLALLEELKRQELELQEHFAAGTLLVRSVEALVQGHSVVR